MSLSHKTVVITGASSGIGAALAVAFSQKGCNLVLAARNEAELEKVASTCKTPLLCVKTDVSIETDCRHLMEKAVEKFGGIDVLVNNAGISMRADFIDANLDVLRKVMDVNFWGTVYCTKYALPFLISARGSVVGISSIAGLKGLPGRTGYSASKFAMHGFLEALRIENLKNKLHVLIAAPGFTATNIRFTALNKDGVPQGKSPREEGKMMTAEEVASLIVEGIEKRKRLIVMTSQGKAAYQLNKFLPALTDRLFAREMNRENR